MVVEGALLVSGVLFNLGMYVTATVCIQEHDLGIMFYAVLRNLWVWSDNKRTTVLQPCYVDNSSK